MIDRRAFLIGLGVTVAGAAIAPSVLASSFTHDAVFVVDVSGSMPIARIQKIVLEASKHNGLLVTFDMDILDVIDLADLTPNTQLKTGGGSCFKCVREYFNEHSLRPRKTVVFTDGFMYDDEWGGLPSNTDFVIIGEHGKDINPPYGTVTHVVEI